MSNGVETTTTFVGVLKSKGTPGKSLGIICRTYQIRMPPFVHFVGLKIYPGSPPCFPHRFQHWIYRVGAVAVVSAAMARSHLVFLLSHHQSSASWWLMVKPIPKKWSLKDKKTSPYWFHGGLYTCLFFFFWGDYYYHWVGYRDPTSSFITFFTIRNVVSFLSFVL